MSLIEEALRRLQSGPLPGESRGTAPLPAPPALGKPQTADTSVHPWPTSPSAGLPPQAVATENSLLTTLLAAAMLVFTVALLIGGAWWISGAMRSAEPPSSAVLPSSQEPIVSPTTPALEAVPSIPTPPPTGALVMTGVVEGEGEPYAVINGAIVAVGEQVGGMTLVEVRRGAATLRGPDGQETTLRVPR